MPCIYFFKDQKEFFFHAFLFFYKKKKNEKNCFAVFSQGGTPFLSWSFSKNRIRKSHFNLV
uniref:Uncharacterized protein n=1 Tax=Chlorella vulgaris TaxID=3077 RepID=V9H1A2_CHLVU|nr:hypothetical protein ChvulCp101 [Chlorella vulgaris]pir/T07288/ hydroxysteroid sulfotransferase homolog - Chlorella vulgaris chloroplast [Chlorella vulgaris]BAA57936.1 unnamed protein product [Chlorella vulgaris]